MIIQDLRGFTLLELLVVVLILGILAGVLVLSISGSKEDSSVSVVQNSLKTIQEQIDIATIKEGGYPSAIDRAWFQAYVLPRHPLIDNTIPKVHNFSTDDRTHPVTKVYTSGLGAYWYNKNNGIVRARVPDQSSIQKTLDLYNRFNQSSLTSVGQKY